MNEHPDREDAAEEQQQGHDEAESPSQGDSPAEQNIPLPEESDAAEEA